MNFDEFNTIRDQALLLHASQTGDHLVGLDAVFAAVAAHAAAQRHTRMGRERRPDADPPPEWFTKALGDHAGQDITASTFCLLAGQTPATHDLVRDVGRWLRQAGKQPRKTGGKLLFRL